MLAAPQIKSIDRKSVHDICSGQVIVTLATAVKELVENSIDAEANSINVTFKEHGLKGIEVSDNGKGIEKENFTGLTLKHHTSKIKEFDDISDVSTFGFRGEALSSLCALGDLSVLTSTGSIGSYLSFDRQGSIKDSCIQARPKGTTIVIENLFSTLPVRHKEFMKNIKKEFHKAIDSLQAYAMISLNTRIHCVNISNKHKQVIFSTQGKPTLKENVIDILGSSVFKNLAAIHLNTSLFEIYGYISKPLPKHGRGSADKQYYFINGRPCDHDKLNKVVNHVFKSFQKFQYPICVLVIEIAKGKIDVNVCPNKRKLFIDNENELIESLHEYLELQFQKYTGMYKEENKSQYLNIFDENNNNIKAEYNSSKLSESNTYSATIGVSTNSNIDNKKPKNMMAENEISNLEIFIKQNALISKVQRKSPTFSEHENIYHNPQDCFVDEEKPNFHINFIEPKKNDLTHSDVDTATAVRKRNSLDCVNKSYVGKFDKSLQSYHMVQVPLLCSLKLIKDQVYIIQKLKQSSYEARKIHFEHQIVSSEDAVHELNKQIEKGMFRKMKILGQFNLGFIIVKLDSNLFIIDQHATDEKYRYEHLKAVTKIETQKLLHPKQLNLNGAQEDLLLSYEHVFNKNGFEFVYVDKNLPGHRISLIAMPRSESQIFDESDVEELLWLLSDEASVNIKHLRPSKVHRMFASRACRSAVMIGTALGNVEMRKILDHMADMDHPWSCPHGRPTMRHLIDLSRTT